MNSIKLPDSEQEIIININSDSKSGSDSSSSWIINGLIIGGIVLAFNPGLINKFLPGLPQSLTQIIPFQVSSQPESNLESNPESNPELRKDYQRFSKVLTELMLPIEGKCSDHSADKGGRTYKGITTATAKRHGWTDDVCSMPESKITDIYYQDYWVKSGAINEESDAVAVVLFDIAVNSGVGKAQQFFEKAPKHFTGKRKALWILLQQRENYKRIVQKDSSQKVFYNGWINRNDRVKNYVNKLEK